MVYADCSNVIASTNELIVKQDERQGGKALAYDGVLRFGLEVAEEKEGNFISEVRWQKSHLDPNQEGITEEERQHVQGNEEADHAAKQAAQEERDR